MGPGWSCTEPGQSIIESGQLCMEPGLSYMEPGQQCMYAWTCILRYEILVEPVTNTMTSHTEVSHANAA